MDKSKLLKQFTDSNEKYLFAKLLDNILKCDKQKQIIFTDFLDPAKVNIFKTVFCQILNIDVEYSIFGGFEGAERQMLAFFPSYLSLDNLQFPIQALLISYNKKYSKILTHRDFLGSITGIGLDRAVIGDIIVNDNEAVIFIKSGMVSYLCSNLEKVGAAKVTISKLSLDSLNIQDKISVTNIVTLSSMRIDNILSKVFNISRAKSGDFVKSEKVFVNWNLLTGSSKIISEGDFISVRGLGRIKVNEVIGQNKKGKIILKISKY